MNNDNGLDSTIDESQNESAETGSLLAEIRGGGSVEDDFVVSDGKRFPYQVTILLIVMVASAVALFGMRKHGMSAGFSFEEVEIDYEFDRDESQQGPGYSVVLKTLANSLTPIEVPGGAPEKNPFFLYVEVTETEAETPTTQRDEDAARLAAERAAEERQRRLRTALADLELNGILGGRRPMARLNGQTVRVGHVIDDLLEVTFIEGRMIRLKAVDGDEEFDLPMGPNPYRNNDDRGW